MKSLPPRDSDHSSEDTVLDVQKMQNRRSFLGQIFSAILAPRLLGPLQKKITSIATLLTSNKAIAQIIPAAYWRRRQGTFVFVGVVNAGTAGPLVSTDGISWSFKTFGAGGSLTNYGVGWNGRVFCAPQFGSSYVFTSPDGMSWTRYTMPGSAGNWNGVAWNGTVFCVSKGNSSVCATSPDGITWTQRNKPASVNWTTIVWNGTVFAHISASSLCSTSPDGITWTLGTMWSGATYTSRGLTFNGSIFVMTPYNGNYSARWTSPDGLNWTLRTAPSLACWQWGIGSRPDTGIIVGPCLNAQSIGASSYDGISWTNTTYPGAASGASQWYSCVWNGNLFASVAQSVVITSPDGITWTRRTITGNVWVFPNGVASNSPPWTKTVP